MGNINIYNRDSLEAMRELSDGSIDLIVTDPPYPVTPHGNVGSAGGMFHKEVNKKGLVFEHNAVHVSEYASEFYRLLKNGTHCYVMTNHVNLIEFLNEFTKAGFLFVKSLIWDKGNKIMGSYYMSQFEYILFFRKGAGRRINNCGTSDIIHVPNIKTKDSMGKNLHDTEKPVQLMRILIENSSNEGDVVLDPFMGVGATGLACQLTKRRFIGFEIDEVYFKRVQDRFGLSLYY